jgi:hypothetical protein
MEERRWGHVELSRNNGAGSRYAWILAFARMTVNLHARECYLVVPAKAVSSL